MFNVGLVTDPIYMQHLTGAGHPESPARIASIAEAVRDLPLLAIDAREAREADLLRCHTKGYIQTLIKDVAKCMQSRVHDGRYQLSTGDTQISPLSLLAAVKATGAVIAGVDAVIREDVKRVFCLVRPPGHHAESDQGMGFCLFNNAAVGARYAQTYKEIEKVAIIDWDVHHGNGTQAIFYDDPTVHYSSTHQFPHYPGTGSREETGIGRGIGTTLNCPINAGKRSREEVLRAFRTEIRPALDKFKPDLIIISAGFDLLEEDPLGGFNATVEDIVELTHIVNKIADVHAEGRIISVLEGGYDIKAIAAAAKAHIHALMS
ncbi:uncharacterized protein slr0245 [Waddlia chondrophila 2032/99]|uniref:histone deacetylase n=1 Tax=Waddlia chondrophila 2032/99 TaxID=765953 RepID=F8LDX0_9BACT|nr:uncharacterized protein slr0245 [Waddlia chondrophila 2032/99]